MIRMCGVESRNKNPTQIGPQTSRRGFTLVELLVVIAIISIIAGFLIPTLIQSRGEADKVACQNNLRELARMGMLYADHGSNRFFPFARGGGGTPEAHESLNILAEHFDNVDPGLFICRTWRGEAAEKDSDDKFVLDADSCAYTWPSQRLAPTDSRPLSCDKYIKSEDQLSGHLKGLNVVDTGNRVQFLTTENLDDDELPKGLVR